MDDDTMILINDHPRPEAISDVFDKWADQLGMKDWRHTATDRKIDDFQVVVDYGMLEFCKICNGSGRVDQSLGAGLGVIIQQWIPCPDCQVAPTHEVPDWIQVGDGR